MRIVWNIEKKRGNLRPLLRYKVMLEEHEKALALPPVRVRSTIPEPPDSWQSHCYPGNHERGGGNSQGMYFLESPAHKGRERDNELRLPWRENNKYPEVEESFILLRKALEEQLASAHSSEPMNEEGEMGTSTEMKTTIAPDILAKRLLQLAG
jgi:hypothetical protein